MLFRSGQSIARFQAQGAARFGGGGNWRITYGVAASSDVKAAVVDGVGNVTSRGQFVLISSSRRGYFAVSHCQRCGGYSCFELIFGCSTTAGDAARSPSCVGQPSHSAGSAVNLDRVAASGRAYSDAVGQFEAHLVVRYAGDDVAVASVFNRFPQLDGIVIRAVADLEAAIFQGIQLAERSEERRVGKECRSRWSPYH